MMLTSGDLFTYYEHGLFKITESSKDKSLCLEKNQLDERGCPLCEADFYPTFVGSLTCIDMGEVEYTDDGPALSGWTDSKDRLWQFERRMVTFKKGGKDRPGMIQEMKRLRQKHGDLKGCVFDCHRSGKLVETCGDRWEFIERVDPANWEQYLLEAGADNPARGDSAGKLELEPFNYPEVIKAHTYEQLKELCRGKSGKSKKGGGFRTEGAGYGT